MGFARLDWGSDRGGGVLSPPTACNFLTGLHERVGVNVKNTLQKQQKNRRGSKQTQPFYQHCGALIELRALLRLLLSHLEYHQATEKFLNRYKPTELQIL